jgi:hypothetical protein
MTCGCWRRWAGCCTWTRSTTTRDNEALTLVEAFRVTDVREAVDRWEARG